VPERVEGTAERVRTTAVRLPGMITKTTALSTPVESSHISGR